MYSRVILLLLLVMALIAGLACSQQPDPRGTVMEPENTYLLLFEVNHYPEGYSAIENDFRNVRLLAESFKELGVPEENVQIWEDDLSQSTLESALAQFTENAPEDAAVLVYVGAHGRYLSNEVKWNDFMTGLWSALPQTHKILIVDACNAGRFVEPFESDATSGITCGIVAANELNWWCSECENLPIVGGIWVHYFATALTTPDADENGDKAVTFNELQSYANVLTQEFMAEHIFSNPEYLKMYEDAGYFPTRKDAYPNAVFIDHIEQDIILATY